jgi:predicted SAM-dependent methyltransferase
MEHFSHEKIQNILIEFRRILKPSGKLVLFWPHANASSVWVLHFFHKLRQIAFNNKKKLHPPEISLLKSKNQASEYLKSAGFELKLYSFGLQDFCVQSVVVGVKI